MHYDDPFDLREHRQMGTKTISRSALFASVGAALLAACGGSQSPIVAPAAISQTAGRPAHADRSLLYVADGETTVGIYSYPSMGLVGNITFNELFPSGICSDKSGDVFVTLLVYRSDFLSYVYEYAHGGTTPIATLTDPGFAIACAVDPTTGNLAVTNYRTDNPPYDEGDVAIYADAQGTPATYSDSQIQDYGYDTYDNDGNLFIDGTGAGPSGNELAVLPSGESSFTNMTLNKSIALYSLQWNDGDLLIASSNNRSGPTYIYRVQVSGSTGTIVGQTTLVSGRHNDAGAQYLVAGSEVLGPSANVSQLEFWRYPKGGHPYRIVKHLSPDSFALSAP
jgi:hypothetical protein